MTTRLKLRSFRLTLVLLLALASAASGAVLRLPLDLRDPELATYIRMGGQITQLCGSLSRDIADGDHCMACDIVPAVIIPDPVAAGQRLRLPELRSLIALTSAQITPPRQTHRQAPRAPPGFSA